MSHPKTDIICLVHNALEVTKGFIKHLYDNTENFRLILVDNGSGPATQNYLEECADMGATVIRSDINLGVIKGRNLGAKSVTADYFLNIDNDQYVQKGWLESLFRLMNQGHDIVGKEAWCLVSPSQGGNAIIEGIQYNRTYYPHKKCTKRTDKFTYIGCGGMLIKKTVYDKIGLFDDRFSPAYFEDPDFCYDKDTYIYTDSGFVQFPNITESTNVLTRNSDGLLEFQKPNWVVKKFERELLHFHNQQIDILCSENQQLLVGYKRGPWQNIDSGKYIEPNFVSAGDISKKLKPRQSRYFIEKSGGYWKGKDQTINICGKNWSLNDFAVFMAWYLSEGNICYDKKKRVDRRDYGITICQTSADNRKEYISGIRDAITALGFSSTVNSKGVSFYCKEFVNYLSQFGKCYEKYIPESIMQAPVKVIKIFLINYLKGDGSVSSDGNKWSFSTSSSKMKDNLIDLLIKCGRSFTYFYRKEGNLKTSSGIYYCKGVWQIQSYSRTIAYLPPPKKVTYNDYTYDINIDNHRILIMRGGKSCWSSNCFRAIKAGFSLGWSHDCPIDHLAHQTIKSQSLFQKNKQFLKSWKLFQEKWYPYFPERPHD